MKSINAFTCWSHKALLDWKDVPAHNVMYCMQACRFKCERTHRHAVTPTNHMLSLTKQVFTHSELWVKWNTWESVRVREGEREWQPHLTHHIHLDGEDRLYLGTTRGAFLPSELALQNHSSPGLYMWVSYERRPRQGQGNWPGILIIQSQRSFTEEWLLRLSSEPDIWLT